jgi:predicted phosphodiesterase
MSRRDTPLKLLPVLLLVPLTLLACHKTGNRELGGGEEGEEAEVPHHLAGLPASPEPDVAVLSGRPSADGALRFAVMGDMMRGGRYAHALAAVLAREADKAGLDAVITTGDNLKEFTPEALNEVFYQSYAPLLDLGIPFYASLGNHDLDHGNADFVSHVPEWHLAGRRWYAVSLNASVEVFLLDSNSVGDESLGPEQLAWLERALTISTAPIKIAAFHHPIYGYSRHRGPSESRRALLEPLFRAHGVQLVFQGHQHIYERLEPVNGIHYFIAGNGSKVDQNSFAPGPGIVTGDDEHLAAMLWEIRGWQAHFRVLAHTGELLDEGEFSLR